MIEIKTGRKIYKISVDGEIFEIPVKAFNAEVGLTLGELEDEISKLEKSNSDRKVFKQIDLLFKMIAVCLENPDHWIPWLKKNLPMNAALIQEFFKGLTAAMFQSNEPEGEKKNGGRKRSKRIEKPA